MNPHLITQGSTQGSYGDHIVVAVFCRREWMDMVQGLVGPSTGAVSLLPHSVGQNKPQPDSEIGEIGSASS